MNATELLANTLSPDAHTRQDATDKLEAASRENYPAYMMMLTTELANESSPAHVRSAAGLALKNTLTARELARQTEYSNRWLALDMNTRNQIKEMTLKTLGSPNSKVGQVAAQFTAAIAAIEFPVAQWLNVIEMLLGFMNQGTTQLRVATLQAIGYICESIKPELLASRSNEILTAVIHGARKEESSPEVQYAAVVALNNSLEFVRANFEREGERNYIMQVVCEATQSPSVQVQVGAFEALVRIMTLYYEKMGFYMERALFGLTVMGMKHSEEAIALQAIEFWSTVAETETELNWESAEAQEFGEVAEIESQNFAKTALPEILPVILGLLLKQDEDADEDEWNVSMAAGTCLGLLATAVCDPIVQGVVPFIEANINGQDWHQREAAVMAFGSILDGPSPESILPLVNQALPVLIGMLKDPNTHVKDTTAWTLGRICDLATEAIQPDVHLHPLITGLVGSLGDAPRIVANSCWALMNLADRLEDGTAEGAQTSVLSPYYDGIVQALLKVTETASQEGNYRTAAYEAITSYMSHAAPDSIEVVNNTAVNVLYRMEQLLNMQNQILGVDDRNNWNDLQSSLCAVLVSIIRKLGGRIQPIADRIMTIMLRLIQEAGKTSTILEDAFLVVGSLASSLDKAFLPYVQAFLPFLHPALKAHEDSQLCTVAVGVIGDISRAIAEETTQYAEAFMTVLFENLSSEVLNRNVKITILSCFGDIALAVGPAFEPYLPTTMTVLSQAGMMMPNPLDIELVEYVIQLREGILEAFTGIISGLKDTAKATLLLPYVQTIFDICQRAVSDQEKTDATGRLVFGIVGDLASTFQNGEIKQALLVDWIAAELRSKRYPAQTKPVQRWAREQYKRATA